MTRTLTPRLWAAMNGLKERGVGEDEHLDAEGFFCRVDCVENGLAGVVGQNDEGTRHDVSLRLPGWIRRSAQPGQLGHCFYETTFVRAGVELGAVELGVDAVAGHQLVVGAVFGDDAAGEDDDLVGVADGAEPMGDGDDGLAFHELFEGVDDEFLGFAVEGGGGLVEQQDGAVANHDAGDADALALAAGEREPRSPTGVS